MGRWVLRPPVTVTRRVLGCCGGRCSIRVVCRVCVPLSAGRLLQARAGLLGLLVTARYRPADPLPFGHRCVECLLHLSSAGGGGLRLRHFADAVEALAQLRCIDGLSAPPLISMAASHVLLLLEVKGGPGLEQQHSVEVAHVTQMAR